MSDSTPTDPPADTGTGTPRGTAPEQVPAPGPLDDPIQTAAERAEAAALPRARAVHADPGTRTAEGEPLPPAMQSDKAKSPAEWAYQRLILYIRNFEQQLDEAHEVAMGFVGGAQGVLRIEGMGYFDPDIVTFYGTDGSGARTQLIQHVSQLNVTLRAVAKEPARPAPRRIGFRLAAELDEVGEPDAASLPDADAGSGTPAPARGTDPDPAG